jgi:hypothetical protein
MNQRKELITRMIELEQEELSCKGCAGNCCTFEANSMMITPLEAFEILIYLENSGKKTEELKVKLEKNIKLYRLDQLAGNGKRSFIRRTYTCPFFMESELGCPLPREIKPYGCLAFNSHHPQLKASEHCFSEKTLLEKIELNEEVKSKNQKISSRLNLDWEKQPIPVALLLLWDHLSLKSEIFN